MSPNGRVTAAVSYGERLTIWDVTTGREQYTLEERIHGAPVFSPDCLDRTLGTIYYDTYAEQPGGSGVFFLTMPIERLTKDKKQNR